VPLGTSLALQLFTAGAALLDPGKTPRELLSARACAGCHVEAHAEWQASRHGLAWTNRIFQREYRERENPWCVTCHAPFGLTGAAASVASEGVSCAVCHVRDGQIHARSHRAGSPHATVVHDDFGDPSFCAGCHQFAFPESRLPMQNTVAEHTAGSRAEIPCRSCHAATPGHHAYPGGHDAGMWIRALGVEVCHDGKGVLVRLENKGAGHRIPTGDVHRHLVLRAWRPSVPEAVQETVLGRRYTLDGDGAKKLLADTSLAPGEARTIRASFARDPEPIAVELRYVFVTDEFPRRDLGEPAFLSIYAGRADEKRWPRCR
jgi:hypothetical protein